MGQFSSFCYNPAMTTIYFLRHGKTKVDGDVPVSQWLLSDTGHEEALGIAEKPEFSRFDVIIASGEEKARQTAEPIAKKLGLDILREPELSELGRDKGGFMNHDEYEKAVHATLTERDASVANWETASHALGRFSKRVSELENIHAGKRVLIVGHGMTMNLYFAQLLGQLDRIYERFNSNTFCDWGVVEDGKVVKDLGN
jgi:probable phosphoglycerate mutase